MSQNVNTQLPSMHERASNSNHEGEPQIADFPQTGMFGVPVGGGVIAVLPKFRPSSSDALLRPQRRDNWHPPGHHQSPGC